jgi:homoserine dehydrogenase
VYLSFDDWNYIPKDKFEWIEEWHAESDRKYLVGVLHATELKENTWWRENGTSLILSPEPIIEDVEVRKLKKKSLELAGLNFN